MGSQGWDCWSQPSSLPERSSGIILCIPGKYLRWASYQSLGYHLMSGFFSFFFFFNKKKKGRTVAFYIHWIKLLIIRAAGFRGNKDLTPFYVKWRKNSYNPAVRMAWAVQPAEGQHCRVDPLCSRQHCAEGGRTLKYPIFGQNHSEKLISPSFVPLPKDITSAALSGRAALLPPFPKGSTSSSVMTSPIITTSRAQCAPEENKLQLFFFLL